MDILIFSIALITTIISSFLIGYYSYSYELNHVNNQPPTASSAHLNIVLPHNNNNNNNNNKDNDNDNDILTRRRQQLFIDIQNVNEELLTPQRSKELFFSLLEMTKSSIGQQQKLHHHPRITLLNHHCYDQFNNTIGDDDDDGDSNININSNSSMISCFGIMDSKGHVIYYAWPGKGLISLEVYIMSDVSLITSLLPKIETLFSAEIKEVEKEGKEEEEEEEEQNKLEDDDNNIHILWSLHLRGFIFNQTSETNNNNITTVIPKQDMNNIIHTTFDFEGWVGNRHYMDVKKEIVSVVNETSQFNIDIWDVLGEGGYPSYYDGLKHNLTEDDSRWLDTDYTTPNRLLFLNGVLKTMLSNEREYYEALIHPAMFIHSIPTNIAIIGGGDGGALREVLKHNTVESITLFVEDPLLINVAKQFLPSLSDCSDFLQGDDYDDDVSSVCFDNERVKIVFEDVKTWFERNYSVSNEQKNNDNDHDIELTINEYQKLDVIVFDLLDTFNDTTKHPRNDEAFLYTLVNALNDNGILVMPFGEPYTLHDIEDTWSKKLMRTMESILTSTSTGNGAMFIYEETHSGYAVADVFLIICKKASCRDRWYADAVSIDYEISKRIRQRTKSKQFSLINYDGSTHELYQTTPRIWEDVYCRRSPQPWECNYRNLDLTKDIFEFNFDDEDESSFEIQYISNHNSDGNNSSESKRVAIVATEYIPKGSYIMTSDLASSFTINNETYNSLLVNAHQIQQQSANKEKVNIVQNFLEYVDNHGHKSIIDGLSKRVVEIGLSSMIRKSSSLDEINVERWMPSRSDDGFEQPVYSPVYDRHQLTLDTMYVSKRDILKGEEIVRSR